MALQDGHGHMKVVGVTVVKSDAGGAGWQSAGLQALHGLVQRQHVEPRGQPATELVKARRMHLIWKQRV